MQTVYIDMDDVLCQTAQHFLTILKREFGKQFTFEQLTDFDVGEACALTAEEREELYLIVHRDKELLSIPPIPGAVDVLRNGALMATRLPSLPAAHRTPMSLPCNGLRNMGCPMTAY